MITQKYLKECLRYCSKSGELTWKKRPDEHFSSQSAANKWNGRFTNTKAGNNGNNGYLVIRLLGRNHQAHRLVWIMLKGQPLGHIDHIDGDRKNNRIENLRIVDQHENNKNKRIYSVNKTGLSGVSFNKSRFSVTIGDTHNGGYIGVFEDFFDACCARKSAENKMGYHKNHGRV